MGGEGSDEDGAKRFPRRGDEGRGGQTVRQAGQMTDSHSVPVRSFAHVTSSRLDPLSNRRRRVRPAESRARLVAIDRVLECPVEDAHHVALAAAARGDLASRLRVRRFHGSDWTIQKSSVGAPAGTRLARPNYRFNTCA